MDKKNLFIKDFLKRVNDLYEGLLDEYDIDDEDALYNLNLGVYTDDDRQLLVGSVNTAIDLEELNLLIDSAMVMYSDIIEREEEDEPQQGTVDWWIKHFGNDNQSLN